jgi:hypothetical protein
MKNNKPIYLIPKWDKKNAVWYFIQRNYYLFHIIEFFRSHRFKIFITLLIILVLSILYASVGVPAGGTKVIAENTQEVEIIIPTAVSDNDISDTDTTELEPITKPTEKKEKEKPIEYYDIPLDKDLQKHIFELCEKHNIDPAIVISIIKTESNFNSSAIGDSGDSLGLMQIQPRWHQERMSSLGCDDLLDPYQNVTVGVDILKDLFSTGNSIEWVLMAYNGGYGYAYDNINQGIVSYYAFSVLSTSKSLMRG